MRRETSLEKINEKLEFWRRIYGGIFFFLLQQNLEFRNPLRMRYPWYPGFLSKLRSRITLKNILTLGRTF